MRRAAAAITVLLLLAALVVLGWNRWPGADTAASSSTVPATSTTATAATTTTVTTTTTPTSTTTTLSNPEIVVAAVLAEEARPVEWFDPLVAVSAGEAWAAMFTGTVDEWGLDLIGHLIDGRWTLYQMTGDGARILALAVGPEGTVWAATDSGVFSFDGEDWTRRFTAPAGGVAVGGDGVVWIGGRHGHLSAPLWLARLDGASWERADPFPDDTPAAYGEAPIAVLPGGEVWIAHRGGYWVEDDLTRYDGATMETVTIPGVPDPTPDNGIPAVWVFAIEADAGGDLWAAGYLAADPLQAVLARYDGATWTLCDWPFPPPAEPPLDVDIATAPDGLLWLTFGDGLWSFDGTAWQGDLEGQFLYNVDVAPDGTVWYSDEDGLHTLTTP